MKAITVTQEHIDRAKRLVSMPGAYIANCCAMALALRDSGFSGALVTCNSWLPLPGVRFPLDEVAQQFVTDFDKGKAVRPQTFRLQAPEPAKEGL